MRRTRWSRSRRSRSLLPALVTLAAIAAITLVASLVFPPEPSLSGRAYVVCNLDVQRRFIGQFDAELVPEFFQAVAGNALLNLHVHQFHGQNGHHIVEAAFKAFGRALDAATRFDERVTGVPSTKGVL